MLPLAVSLGDPAGVGPELIAEAWARREADSLPPFFVCDGAEVLRQAASARFIDVPVAPIDAPEDASACTDALPVLGDGNCDYRPGKPDADGARLAFRSLETAALLAAEGRASGMVTGPVSKAALAQVGFDWPGQTEFVAAMAQRPVDHAVMMLAGPSLRTIPLTVHCALRDVADRLSVELIVDKARTVAAALRMDFGIGNPRLAICGLNPHAGENGRMGREEIEIIAPAIAALRAEGVDATGPHPADAMFAARARSTYDAALAMYHDQALVPLKALDFDEGVNVTLGLQIVRTSPDHGTAFDIAGTGKAHPGAMIAAIRMAGEIAARRQAANA